MSNVSVAAPMRQRIVPAFVVKKLDGQVEHTVIQFDKEGKKHDKVVKVDAGFMVSFPSKGHSIRVRSVDELKRLGFDKTVPLVDDGSENDDVVGYIDNNIAA